ncbi:head GIN domain-containing protein [Pedobacter sp. MW01-1-1]|uniref:head GIN domain-containing protein n=1 Tax=Pedobacter sp. MW01-1-1 TaxID=3383027 RepID=UPI003FEED927
MKNLLKSAVLFSLVLSSMLSQAQDSKKFPVSNFEAIGVSSGINLYLTQGNSESVSIQADAEILSNIVVEQKGKNLNIHFKEGFNWNSLFNNKQINAYVNYKKLNAIAASGGSDVFSKNPIKTEKMSINSSGGADIKIDLFCTNLSVATSGGSDVYLKGKAENMNIASSGGSDIKAYDFITQYAKVNSSGGSDVYINVAKGLEANASGGSDIHYKGNASLKSSNSKSGDVKHVQ